MVAYQICSARIPVLGPTTIGSVNQNLDSFDEMAIQILISTQYFQRGMNNMKDNSKCIMYTVNYDKNLAGSTFNFLAFSHRFSHGGLNFSLTEISNT